MSSQLVDLRSEAITTPGIYFHHRFSFPLGYAVYVGPNHNPYDVRVCSQFSIASISLSYSRVLAAVASDRLQPFDNRNHRTVYIPADTEYRTVADQGTAEYVLLGLNPAAMEAHGMAVFGDAFSAADFDAVNFDIDDPSLAQIGRRLRRLLMVNDPHLTPLVEEQLVLAVTRLLPRIKRARRRPNRYGPRLNQCQLKRIIDYVESQLGCTITLSDLASIAKMDLYNFAKGFRKETGQSPYQYVLERRIRRSRILLERSDRPIADVAFACGFSSQQHLTNTFRRVLDTTPFRYRRRTRG